MSAPAVRGPRPGRAAAAARPGAPSGGYVLAEAVGEGPAAVPPDVVLVAHAGEERAALDARRILQGEGIATRVVAMPRAASFRQQPRAYRDSVLPPAAVTVSVATGARLGWYQLLAGAGQQDAAGSRALADSPGLTPQRVAATARAALARAAGKGHP
ncbi:hypothetical protein ACFP1Z_25955 [Streptomyces gamaensis]|uniref:Transketolase-like C-terminal domain-containing protein n=1 Tax=Streptomyces gamaensis TaxID=1763542 RepID=A0ABW0Z4F4_9ACTN